MSLYVLEKMHPPLRIDSSSKGVGRLCGKSNFGHNVHILEKKNASRIEKVFYTTLDILSLILIVDEISITIALTLFFFLLAFFFFVIKFELSHFPEITVIL